MTGLAAARKELETTIGIKGKDKEEGERAIVSGDSSVPNEQNLSPSTSQGRQVAMTDDQFRTFTEVQAENYKLHQELAQRDVPINKQQQPIDHEDTPPPDESAGLPQSQPQVDEARPSKRPRRA